MNTNLQKIMITDFKHINFISVFDLFKPIKAQLAIQLELKYLYEKYKDTHYRINELQKLGNEINLCLLENELEKLQLFIAKNKTTPINPTIIIIIATARATKSHSSCLKFSL